MWPVTARFAAEVAQSHHMLVSVEVLQNGVAVGNPLTTVTAGNVTLDATAQVRGRLDVTIVDDGSLGLVPSSAADLLAPYGNELRVRRGVRYSDGTTEYASLGVFRIDEPNVSDAAGSLTIQIAGQDRAARIADAKFEDPADIAAGINVATQILNLIQAVYPDVTTSFVTTPYVTAHMTVEEGADRWDLCQQFAVNAGLRLYFNGDGTLILANAAPGSPVATMAEGAGGLLLDAARNWTRQGAYNRWIVTGENTGVGTPVRGVATDDDATSPTYYSGPFGRVPKFTQSQFVTTTAQAIDAAEAMKARELGTTQSVNFGSVVLPHLEPGDVVLVTRERVGITAENHVLDVMTVPLTADGAMTATTRATLVTT